MAPCEEWEYEMVDRLVAQGKLSIESFMQRLDKTIATSSAIPSEVKPELKRVFDSVSNTAGLLTESALLALFQTRTAIPLSPELVEANRIVFSALRYLGTLPCPGSDIRDPVNGITFAQLSRALVWVLPENSRYIFEEDNFSRGRTPADHRRLLFQSLASSHDHPLYDAAVARKLALRNAFDTDREFLANLCAVNFDDDGDEIFHDLLETLYSTQEQIPGIAPAKMDAFRPLAKTISLENNSPSLRTLGIPATRFVSLLRLLLAMQFQPPTAEEEPVDLACFTSAAESICDAFAAPDAHNLITHPSFDHALRQLAPYLFDPLLQFLSLTFLGRTHGLLSANLARPSQLPSTPGPNMLTLPLAAQLTTFLCWNVDFTSINLHAHFTPSSPPSGASDLVASLTPPGDSAPPSVLLLQGRNTTSSERVVFGLFTPHPENDGHAIHDFRVPSQIGDHGCALFQLAPSYGVFRGTVGKPGWSVLDEETVVFGAVGAGVCMTLTLPGLGSGGEEAGREQGDGKGLGRATIRQAVVNSGDGEDDEDDTRGWDRETGWFEEAQARRNREKAAWTYEADVKRGNWIVEVELERVEVWSEREEE